jgi:hypothetical protein
MGGGRRDLDHLWPCPHGVAVCEPCAYDRGYSRFKVLAEAVEAYHEQFQKVATCTEGDVDDHIREQMERHAVMLTLARESHA